MMVVGLEKVPMDAVVDILVDVVEKIDFVAVVVDT